MAYNTLLIADDGAIRTITINRPEKLNALNREVITELDAAFTDAGRDDGVRVIVLTGAGQKAFVAGADIGELSALTPVQALEFARYGQRMMTRVERLGKPVIAAIGGFALGGGLELAMACHLRIASDTAKVGQPEINLAVPPGFGGTQRLLRLAGRAATLELCLLGAPINAQRALELGVLTRVVPADQLAGEVRKVAEQLAASAPHAMRGILDAILIGGEAPLDVGLEYEAQAFGVCVATDDMREGTKAFLEKRKAHFAGR
ncbi:MAG TPA: enoyl-CoA hydratase-related protein [Xanthomonadales bacterium]|nr:enoyl-CoA hydratase-related protein [Xanthomonadales bacterium]